MSNYPLFFYGKIYWNIASAKAAVNLNGPDILAQDTCTSSEIHQYHWFHIIANLQKSLEPFCPNF